MHRDYLIPMQGIESLADSLYKLNEEEQLAADETRMAQERLTAAQEKQRNAAQKPVDTRQNAEIEGGVN